MQDLFTDISKRLPKPQQEAFGGDVADLRKGGGGGGAGGGDGEGGGGKAKGGCC